MSNRTPSPQRDRSGSFFKQWSDVIKKMPLNSSSQRLNDEDAKKVLQQLLGDFSVGRILGLLSELWYESAEEARKEKDMLSERIFLKVGGALEATALGIDYMDPP